MCPWVLGKTGSAADVACRLSSQPALKPADKQCHVRTACSSLSTLSVPLQQQLMLLLLLLQQQQSCLLPMQRCRLS